MGRIQALIESVLRLDESFGDVRSAVHGGDGIGVVIAFDRDTMSPSEWVRAQEYVNSDLARIKRNIEKDAKRIAGEFTSELEALIRAAIKNPPDDPWADLMGLIFETQGNVMGRLPADVRRLIQTSPYIAEDIGDAFGKHYDDFKLAEAIEYGDPVKPSDVMNAPKMKAEIARAISEPLKRLIDGRIAAPLKYRRGER